MEVMKITSNYHRCPLTTGYSLWITLCRLCIGFMRLFSPHSSKIGIATLLLFIRCSYVLRPECYSVDIPSWQVSFSFQKKTVYTEEVLGLGDLRPYLYKNQWTNRCLSVQRRDEFPPECQYQCRCRGTDNKMFHEPYGLRNHGRRRVWFPDGASFEKSRWKR